MHPSWLIDLPTCDSTNSWALTRTEALTHGACIFTTHQTSGRGQPGNTWHSPPGVITASFVLDLNPFAPITQMALAAGLAVAHATEDYAPNMSVMLKWPNDCMVNNRKLAGVLCEQPHAYPHRMIVGIGLNCDPHWDQCPVALPYASDARLAPVSLSEFTTSIPSSIDVLSKMRQYLIEAAGLIAAGAWHKLLPELNARDALKNRPLRLTTPSAILQGIGDGIDESGRLLVQTPDGIVAVSSARSVTIINE